MRRATSVNTTWLSAATATPARALWRPYVMIVACLLHAGSGPLAIAVRLDTCTSEQKGAVTVKRLPVPVEEMVQLDPQEAALLNLYRDNRVTTVGYVAGRFAFPGLFRRACGCEVRFPLAPDHQCPAHRTLHD